NNNNNNNNNIRTQKTLLPGVSHKFETVHGGDVYIRLRKKIATTYVHYRCDGLRTLPVGFQVLKYSAWGQPPKLILLRTSRCFYDNSVTFDLGRIWRTNTKKRHTTTKGHNENDASKRHQFQLITQAASIPERGCR
ncbi:unnamed protein product, partial [Ectocarpus sp. 13 AM-2016]